MLKGDVSVYLNFLIFSSISAKMFLFIQPTKPIILPNNIFILNLQRILQNKIYGIRQFSSKSEGFFKL